MVSYLISITFYSHLMLRFSLIWPAGVPSVWLVCPSDMPCQSLSTFLLPYCLEQKLFQAYFIIFLSTPAIKHLFKVL